MDVDQVSEFLGGSAIRIFREAFEKSLEAESSDIRNSLINDGRYSRIWYQIRVFSKGGDRESLDIALARAKTVAAEKRVRAEWAAVELFSEFLRLAVRRIVF